MRIFYRLIVTTATIGACIATQSEGQAWPENGTNQVEDANIKSSKGFGAQLWLTDKTKFFDDWNKNTLSVALHPTRKAIRGKPFFTAIIFTNPGIGSNGLSNVTGDIVVRKPDGSIYGEIKDANFWRNLSPPDPGQLQLAVDYLGIVIEESDPAGRYLVEATIIDHVKNSQLSLSEHFDVDGQK